MLELIYKDFENDIRNYTSEPLVYGYGNSKANIMLIGEAPGKDEVKLGRPFTGKAGKQLDEFLIMTGLNRELLYITNVVKFRPYILSEKGTKRNRPPSKKEIELCKNCLLREIKAINPKWIITLGNTALHAMMEDAANIGSVHGTIRMCNSRYVFALYHPASVIYNRDLAEVYKRDLAVLHDILKADGMVIHYS